MSGRERDLREFIQREDVWLRRRALLMCGDWHRAHDIAQDVWVKLYRHWPTLRRRPDAVIRAYLERTLFSTVIDESRRPARRFEYSTADLPVMPVHDPDAARAVAVRRVLQSLPDKQRAAVVLVVMDQLSVQEAARLLDCQPATVRSHVSRGLQRLRQLVGDTPHEPQLI